ncbi:MAG TPA: alkaline phosphatase family protein [Gemmatimonadaceae bacterium]|jgi:predicted AlkP superfamily phosphohydrolase/phosphomutase
MQIRHITRLGVVAAAVVFSFPLSAQSKATPAHRAILVSFDGFSELRFREYGDSAAAPHVWSMFRNGVCAESVRPAFPSVTPVGHASIWTGAYANVNGVAAQSTAKLPLTMTSILDWTDGYKATALRAEPIWIAAARQGKTVYSHMATQSPQPPTYMPVVRPIPSLDSARAVGVAAMAMPTIAALNIYNEQIALPRLITSPDELSWAFGTEGDSLHAVIRDDSTVVVQLNGEHDRAVTVHLAPTDTTPMRGRPLARFFSKALRVSLRRNRTTFVYFRLFELAPDRSKLMLFVSEARVMQANHPEVADSYNAEVQGVPGNGATKLMEHGDFGPRVPNGGKGIAEYRYFETAELVTRQFMRGSAWGAKTYRADLSTDYLPYPDEILHTFLGFASPTTPGVPTAGRENAQRMLRRGYGLVDLYLEQLQSFAAKDPNMRIFVTGEHGMRPAWMSFRPNVVLAQAGLLSADTAGTIILRRTRAAAANGGWVTVNRATRNSGVVPADSVEPVLARAEAALLAVRDSAGTSIVTRVFRANTVEGDSLGLGGPGGGDLYWSLAPGYYWSSVATGPAVVPLAFPQGEHGFPSIDRDMQPALCILGEGKARRIGQVRSIDIAPSVSEWLGIAPPGDARGKSLLSKK